MPIRAQVYTWIAGFGLVVMPSLALAQDRTEREVVELIVRDGPQARAIRAEPEVTRREQDARLAYPNPAVTYSRESAGFTEFLQAEQSLPLFGARAALSRAGVAATAAAEADRDVRLWVMRSDAAAAVARLVAEQARFELAQAHAREVERLIEILRTRQLLWLSLGVIVAIFFILSAAFGSSRDGLLIMLNLPLALIGGVLGVYLSGGVLSVASIVGFITLFGIATRSGIMLVSHIRHLQEQEGVTDFRTAVIRGATERLVPILMTALAAGLALVPIALSAGEPGSEIQAPMAMVIMFGLLSSTALNMIVVPILYERFGCPVSSPLDFESA
jgi:preprotein translocase subunit SecF